MGWPLMAGKIWLYGHMRTSIWGRVAGWVAVSIGSQ